VGNAAVVERVVAAVIVTAIKPKQKVNFKSGSFRSVASPRSSRAVRS
jgi:hypothetical protein